MSDLVGNPEDRFSHDEAHFSGRVVNKMRNHEDEDIKKAAKKVYVKWKTHFVEHLERPMMEVQCDLKTEKLRTSGRKLLTDALSVEVSTVMILSFQTSRLGQTVQTQIRLLLEEQSDQGLHRLLFHLHHFDKIPVGMGLFV